MKMTAPLEIGICVQDLERMTAFYCDVLELDEVSTFEVPPEKSAPATFAADGYRIVRLQTNRGERLKLAGPNAKPLSRAAETDVLARQGNVFLTFIVDDLKAQIAALEKAGAKLRTGSRRVEVRDGVYLAFAEDPEGNYLEFVEYRDLAAYRPDVA